MRNVLPTEWNPVAVGNLQKELGSFRNWTLCGGYSVDQWAGRTTRPHGDIDVGVFRSELRECLGAIGRGRVYLCSPTGTHKAWEGGDVHESIHDIWITDATGKYWILQIMVFDDDGDRVRYRRDRRIHWSKGSHSIEAAGIRLLNPFITMLYKSNKNRMEDKEVADIVTLIETHAEPFAPRRRWVVGPGTSLKPNQQDKMNTTTMQLNPYLSFNGQCEAAFKFYERCLGGKIECIMPYESRPAENPVPAGWRKKILHVTLRVGDQVLMGADAPPDRYQKPQGFSVTLGLKDQAEAERMFKALAEKGTVEMALQETFWAVRFGVLVDRFGIPWTVNCERPACVDPASDQGNYR